MSRAGLSLPDLSMFVKSNKNQLRDYMTTGPAHTEAARLTGPLSPAHVIRPLLLGRSWIQVQAQSTRENKA